MQLRAAIEGLCARIVVAERLVPVEELERCLAGIERAILSNPVDRRGYVQYDLGFHRALVHASGNTHALRHWSLLEAQIHAMLLLFLEDLDVTVESTIGLHRALLETLRGGSAEDAEQALNLHGLGVIQCLEKRLGKENVL
jgi:DNA-binding GntR family transcriptional regulator